MPNSGEWYVEADGGRRGPMKDAEFAALIKAGGLRVGDWVKGPGFSDWKPAEEILDMLARASGSERSPTEPRSVPDMIIEANSGTSPGKSELRTSRRNYFARHWLGELSLPISYWVNAWLGSIAVLLIFAAVPFAVDITEHPAIFAVTVSAAWLLAIAISIWQLVGVWRSAGNHKARGGRGFWAGAARLMVVLGFIGLLPTVFNETFPQIAELWRIASGDTGTGKHQLRILRGGTELEYSGGITFGATDEVRSLLDADAAIRVIHLNSQGGRLAEARKLRDLVRERKLFTYAASACASACTIAFMGGVQRFIAAEAKLGFHRGRFPGATDAELTAENETDRRWLISTGVPAWFADRAYSTPSNSMWWPTSEELRRAGVVTGIARPNDFALSGMGTTNREYDIDAELQKIPLYRAIKHADPQTYQKISASLIEAQKLGKSQAELVASARPYITGISRKYLSVASDEAVIATAEVGVIEAEAIGRTSANACYDFLYPHPGSQPVIISDYVSNDIQDRDLSATAAVIETGGTNPQQIPTDKEVSPLLKNVVDRLTQKYSAADLAVLADPNASGIDHERVCRMTSALYREVLTLPAKAGARLLRFLFAQGREQVAN